MKRLSPPTSYTPLEGGALRCDICSRTCHIKAGERGFCRIRVNEGGKLYNAKYGELAFSAVDLIERIPLYHFWPGSFTVGVASPCCNFTCPWCSNWFIAQNEPDEIPTETPSVEFLLKAAEEYNCKSITYQYTEPTIWYDYALEIAGAAQEAGLHNIFNTNGYMTPQTLNEILPYLSAANVDIKTFSDETYRAQCGGGLKPVLETAKRMKDYGVHVEISHLMVPGVNTDLFEARELYRWVKANLGAETPVHVEKYTPNHRIPASPTSEAILLEAREVALREGLQYVYCLGLIEHETAINTYCPGCGERVVKRWHVEILEWNLTEDMRCRGCGEKLNVAGEYSSARRIKFPACCIDPDVGGLPVAQLTHGYLGTVGKFSDYVVGGKPQLKGAYTIFEDYRGCE